MQSYIAVAALMCSHLSAFRIAGNIRKALMSHIAQLPLGFIGEMGSGKIRCIVNDSSAATETYLAHQLPDMAAAITTPVCMVIMLCSCSIGSLVLSTFCRSSWDSRPCSK